MPLFEVGYIRVTHPCAGRRQMKQASFPLPLDLHVLGLPLAFILSQDQTLHCKNKLFINLSSNLKGIVWNYSFSRVNKTFLAAQISSKNCIYRHLAVLDSFFNRLPFLWRKSVAKVRQVFLISKYFWSFFWKTFFLRTLLNLWGCSLI